MNKCHLLNRLDPLLKSLNEKFFSELASFEYRYKRYHVNYSVAIYALDEEIEADFFYKNIRRSDHCILIQKNFYIVIFDSTNEEQGGKAANNILVNFEHFYFSKPLFFSLVSSTNYSSAKTMVYTLFNLLHYGMSNNMHNILIDESRVVGKNN
jgi:hypothetical protein